MLLAALVMIPTVWLPDQKALSYLGFCGIAATLTVSAAVVFTFLSGAPAPSLAARHSLPRKASMILHAGKKVVGQGRFSGFLGV